LLKQPFAGKTVRDFEINMDMARQSTSVVSNFELRLPAFNFEKEREDEFLNEKPPLKEPAASLATPHHHSAAPASAGYGYTGQGTSHCAPENTDKNEPEAWVHGPGVRTSLLPSPSLITTTSTSSSSETSHADASSSYISQPQYSPPPIPQTQTHTQQFQKKQLPTTTKSYIPYYPAPPPPPTTTPPPIPEDALPDRNSPVQLIISSAPNSPVQENKKSNSDGYFEPKLLQKASTMPVAKAPPVPVPESQSIHATPPRAPPSVPLVTATQATPNDGRDYQNRSPSPDHPPPSAAKLQPNRLQPRHASPAPRGRSVSAQQQNLRGLSADGYRAVSNPLDSGRAPSTNSGEGSPTGLHPMSGVAKKRKSWLPGSRSRSNSVEVNSQKGTGAWIMCPDAQVDYNVAPLTTGEKVGCQ
jgi:hypothetical protein